MVPVFVIVMEEENGSLLLGGSETTAVTRGTKATMAAGTPIRVAIPRTTASRDIPVFFLFAFGFCFCGLAILGPLFDIKASLSEWIRSTIHATLSA
jgi:hypothetical protein